MKKTELLQILDRDELLRLYRSELLVDKIVEFDTQLLIRFIDWLPDEISEQEIMAHWSKDWKKIESNGFLTTLKKLSYCEFKKINDLHKLIDYWYATPSRHLRAVIRQIVLELMPFKAGPPKQQKRPIDITPELIRDLYFIIYTHCPDD